MKMKKAQQLYLLACLNLLQSKALEQNLTSLRLKMAKDVIYIDHISHH